MKTLSSQRGLRWGALLLMAGLSGLPAHARVHHTESWAHDRFATAERMHEALNGRPPAELTRRDYQHVINAYRNVYYGAPTSTKADPSVVAVAETLVEMGRRFDDAKILNSAIGEYKFLRREYPGSKYRCDALFTIGEIYKDDLGEPDQARSTFQDFLHRYPNNRLVDDARQAIAELEQSEFQQARAAKSPGRENSDKSGRGDAAGKSAPAAGGSKADSSVSGKPAADGLSSAQASSLHPAEAQSAEAQSADRQASGHQSPDRQSERQGASYPRVTGIRHWSTPDYTRVAIDLENEVDFSSQRIAHPDRIFFDLRNTKLASTLVGKNFDVDDGFLKKIRVAQFQPGRTRVVLEVANLSGYNAFLLPNPYRLIIDIHGRDIHGRDIRGKENRGKDAAAKNARGRQLEDSDEIALAPDVEVDPTVNSKSEQTAVSSNQKLGAKLNQMAGLKQGGVVKKIVEAADSDSDDAQNATSTESASTTAPKPDKAHASSHAVKAGAGTAPKRDDAASEASDDSSLAANDDNADLSPVPAPKSKRTGKSRLSSKTLDSKNLDSTTQADLEIHEAKPTAHGDRSLIRALGLKIGKIVIDPGHGGHDTGTIGPNGLEEKDLVLEVGKRLGKMLETRLGAEVVYTRKDDTFIPLETRTAIANQERADLFISIHANSSEDPTARGVETYYLNFTSSPEALEVAARENAVSEKSIYELRDLVKKIALKEKIDESREFAGDVQQSLHSGLAAKSPAIRDRGVKKAPFIVLIGANMPSILAEISFVSNPTDEHRLETAEYRQRIADSLYRGIAKYVSGLSGVKVASKLDKPAGQ